MIDLLTRGLAAIVGENKLHFSPLRITPEGLPIFSMTQLNIGSNIGEPFTVYDQSLDMWFVRSCISLITIKVMF